jgi:hypothetical protein
MTFYSSDETLLQPAVKAFITTVKQSFPVDVSFAVPSEGDTIDPTTGNLTGAWSAGTPATLVGGSNSVYAAPAGACISWTTNSIVTGIGGRSRRLRGRTFLVPLASPVYQTDGSLEPATLGIMRTAASALWVAAELAIWHRPTSSGATDGLWSDVTASDVKDRVAILTSRRA